MQNAFSHKIRLYDRLLGLPVVEVLEESVRISRVQQNSEVNLLFQCCSFIAGCDRGWVVDATSALPTWCWREPLLTVFPHWCRYLQAAVITMFKANYMDSNCLRCGKTVYPTDKIGPLKDYSFFHSGCFRCVECSSKLTLKAGFIMAQKRLNKSIKR